jgi:hypothetical protein
MRLNHTSNQKSGAMTITGHNLYHEYKYQRHHEPSVQRAQIN